MNDEYVNNPAMEDLDPWEEQEMDEMWSKSAKYLQKKQQQYQQQRQNQLLQEAIMEAAQEGGVSAEELMQDIGYLGQVEGPNLEKHFKEQAKSYLVAAGKRGKSLRQRDSQGRFVKEQPQPQQRQSQGQPRPIQTEPAIKRKADLLQKVDKGYRASDDEIIDTFDDVLSAILDQPSR